MKATDDRSVDPDPSELTARDAVSAGEAFYLGGALVSGLALAALSYPDPGLSAVAFFLVLASGLGLGVTRMV